MKKTKKYLFGFILIMPFLNGCSTHKTSAVLTAKGAYRVNAAASRNAKQQELFSPYSSWLNPSYLATKRTTTVKEGDEYTTDMEIEIYPSDKYSMNRLFLIGVNNYDKPSNLLATSSTTEPLIKISTSLSESELSKYDLNGEIKAINSQPTTDVNVEYENLSFETEYKYTMTYTYIKTGTAADSSPYACQPTFTLLKVDNEVPTQKDETSLEVCTSYTSTKDQIVAAVTNKLRDSFETIDPDLKLQVEITDSRDLETLRDDAITAAKASATYAFPAYDLEVRVYTKNATTSNFTVKLQFVDDIAPILKNTDGTKATSLVLNGGTELQLCHDDVIDKGASELAKNKYYYDDEIRGKVDFDFDVAEDGYLTIKSGTNVIKDTTTKFSFSTRTIRVNKKYVTQKYITRNGFEAVGYVISSDNEVECISLIEKVTAKDNKIFTVIIDTLLVNSNSAFEEELNPTKVSGKFYYVVSLVLNSKNKISIASNIVIAWGYDTSESWYHKFFYNTDCFDSIEYIEDSKKFYIGDIIIYTNSSSYSLISSEYNRTIYRFIYFLSPYDITREKEKFNTSLDEFKTISGLSY